MHEFSVFDIVLNFESITEKETKQSMRGGIFLNKRDVRKKFAQTNHEFTLLLVVLEYDDTSSFSNRIGRFYTRDTKY